MKVESNIVVSAKVELAQRLDGKCCTQRVYELRIFLLFGLVNSVCNNVNYRMGKSLVCEL